MQNGTISVLRFAAIIAIMLLLMVMIIRRERIEECPSTGVSGNRTFLSGSGQERTVEPSVRVFSGDFIVTEGEKVVLDNHARIVFSNHANLVVKGSLSVIGTEQDPVVLQMGKGMIRLEEGADLTMEHCVLTGEDSEERSLFYSRNASFFLKNVTVTNTERKIIYSIEGNKDDLEQVFVSPRCYDVKTYEYISAEECGSTVFICSLDTHDNILDGFSGFSPFVTGNIEIRDSYIRGESSRRLNLTIRRIVNSRINQNMEVNFARSCEFDACQPYAHSYDYRCQPVEFAVDSCVIKNLRVYWDSMRPYDDLIILPYKKCKLHYDIIHDVDKVVNEEATLDESNCFNKYMIYGGLKWFANFCSLNINGNEIYITIRKDQEKRVREDMAKHKLDIHEDGEYYKIIPLVNNE